MPGLVVFGRRWGIASDDLGPPTAVEFVLRAACWVILLGTVVAVLITFDPLGSRRSVAPVEGADGVDGAGTAGPSGRATGVWERRMRLICCCVRRDESSHVAFTDVARILSEFFADTDLVGSDVAAGLTLLHRKQKRDDHERQHNVQTRTPSPSTETAAPVAELAEELSLAAHYMRFAAASYGWPLFVYSHPFSGLCHLCPACSCCCCRRQGSGFALIGGEPPPCHVRAMRRTTDLQDRDFIFVSYHNRVYEVPFYVALDHATGSIVVSVRGTMSLRDVLTDLTADCENLEVEGVSPHDCFAHKGMVQAARYVYGRLVNDGILVGALAIVPEYRVVVTGHSLGAGTAAILALLLKPSYPSLRCYAFSPPGGLLSEALSKHAQQFIISVVLGLDLVPRLSLANMDDLKENILTMILTSDQPKYKILLCACCRGGSVGCAGDDDDMPASPTSPPHGEATAHDSHSPPEPSQPLLSGGSERRASYRSLDSTPTNNVAPEQIPTAAAAATQRPLLFLPGRVVHITKTPARDKTWDGPRFQVNWSHASTFTTIRISPRMLPDHMPGALLNVLAELAPPPERHDGVHPGTTPGPTPGVPGREQVEPVLA
uniref:Diacylglycerol lipase-beta n=1 Tax=Petromyzon marinus TaxID=7757 RepID=A0AAJ7UBR4_PETMA|nr:sn1-specific diacylglycerol lipase beta isoform X2 [Petromyzon marinus]